MVVKRNIYEISSLNFAEKKTTRENLSQNLSPDTFVIDALRVQYVMYNQNEIPAC